MLAVVLARQDDAVTNATARVASVVRDDAPDRRREQGDCEDSAEERGEYTRHAVSRLCLNLRIRSECRVASRQGQRDGMFGALGADTRGGRRPAAGGAEDMQSARDASDTYLR